MARVASARSSGSGAPMYRCWYSQTRARAISTSTLDTPEASTAKKAPSLSKAAFGALRNPRRLIAHHRLP